jgi:predicted DsbA family dithiol-disulfide isomerase
MARFGGDESLGRLAGMFDAAGLPHAAAIDVVPNSRRALALTEAARAFGAAGELHARLFDAYWARGRDIGRCDVLVEEAGGAGMRADAARAALRAEPSDDDAVARSTAEAVELGISGVPAWIVDERLLVPGAQPHEVFDRVLEKLGHASLVD